VRDQAHPPGELVVLRRLGRIARDEDDRVPPGDREGIGLGVVVDQADQLAQLVHVEVGLALDVGELLRCCPRHGRTVARGTGSSNCPRTRWPACTDCQSRPRSTCTVCACRVLTDDRSTTSTPGCSRCSPPSRRSGCWGPPASSVWPAARYRPGWTGCCAPA